MSSLDKALNNLLDLGDPAVRRERAEQLDQTLRTLLALTDGDAAAIALPGREDRLVLHTGSAVPVLTPEHPEGSEVLRMFTQDPHPISVADLADDARFVTRDACPGVESGPALFAALRKRNLNPGCLAVYRRRGRARFSPSDSRAIVLLATSLQHSLEAQRLSRSVAKLALTDDLTEVYNARFVKSALKRELRRAARFGQELSLLLVEPDNFRSWESGADGDTRDVRIKEVAGHLVAQVRSFDFVARSGPGQFLVVLPQTPVSGATEVAERIKSAIESAAVSGAQPGAVTVSIGIAAFPTDGAEPEALIAKASRALVPAQGGRGSEGNASAA